MKRIICLLLITAILFTGCSLNLKKVKEPVEFYYPRACEKPDEQKVYFSEGAFGSEIREASGRRQDLYYLLFIYLRGPLDPGLVSPFPTGSSVVKIQKDDQDLYVYLNAVAANLEDMDLTIACACLAKTCMALTDVTAVHIESRGFDDKVLFSNIITASSLLLEESSPPSIAPAEETINGGIS